MFDSLVDENGNEWQTKAYHCGLDVYRGGDQAPDLIGVYYGMAVKSAPADYQVEVLGGDFVDAYATVRRGIFISIGVERDDALPLVSYEGNPAARADA